ncbi:MAG TPA: hypothetical protein VM597_31940 [Gemmataceae bacterium]|nr:hypothetical protein [Gemmataceae bacterium]
MNRLLTLLIASTLAAGGLAQEPPKPADKKAEPKKEAGTPPEEEVDVQKTAERIAENATKAGDRLRDKDLGADTRKIQDEIVKDIEALLKKAQQPPPQSPDMNPMMPPPEGMPPPKSGMPPPMGGIPPPKGGSGQQNPMPMPMGGMGGGSQSPKPSGSGQKPQGGRREQRMRRQGNDPMGGMNPMSMPKADPGGVEPMPAKLEPKDGPEGKEPKGDRPDQFGKASPKRQNDKMADLYNDVWGHLPDRMRQEMDLYYREQFMPRYSELLRRYYAALAEQRKKGDDR